MVPECPNGYATYSGVNAEVGERDGRGNEPRGAGWADEEGPGEMGRGLGSCKPVGSIRRTLPAFTRGDVRAASPAGQINDGLGARTIQNCPPCLDSHRSLLPLNQPHVPLCGRGEAALSNMGGLAYHYDLIQDVMDSCSVVMARKHENWMRDVTERQRNIVFPDTVSNEGRFWRNLLLGKEHLNAVQVAGVVILVIWAVALAISLTLGDNPSSSWWHNIFSALIRWTVALAILIVFLAIFRISQLYNRKRNFTARAAGKRNASGTVSQRKR